MKTTRIYFSMMLLGAIVLISACTSHRRTEPRIMVTPTETTIPLVSTSAPARATTDTFTENLKPIHLTASAKAEWHATAIAIQETERAVSQQSQNAKETQIAQFSIDCDDVDFYSSSISSDGKWFAASCGYKQNQTLIVQNREGTKWVLRFRDFLNHQRSDEIPGILAPKFWSPDGNYLYFTIGLGYSGGGDLCFPQPGEYGAYGLFRLNLKTGFWATVIASTDSFPGYEIEFSSTGRRYAITIDGVMINDLQTGKSTKIATNGTIERLNWSLDGKYLAYSLASCDEQNILSSSLYVWEASTNQTQILLEKDGIILRPESWEDSSTLRIIGEEISGRDTFYTIYEYSISQGNMLFTGTATPYP